MARTDKTRPYWVRQADPLERKVYKTSWGTGFQAPCGRGCGYCGWSRTRRRFEQHRTRNASRRELRGLSRSFRTGEGEW